MIPAAKQPVMMRATTSISSDDAIEHSTVESVRPHTMMRSMRRRPTLSPSAPHTGCRQPYGMRYAVKMIVATDGSTPSVLAIDGRAGDTNQLSAADTRPQKPSAMTVPR